MAYPQTTPPVEVGIPIRGMNRRDPLASMSPEYCPWLLNWEPEPQYLRHRNGWTVHATLTAQDAIMGMGVLGGTQLFAYATKLGAFNRIYNVTAAGPQPSASAVWTLAAGGVTISDFVRAANYRGRLAFLTPSDPANKCRSTVNGTTWIDPAWTTGGTPLGAYVTKAYKGRVYHFSASVPTFYYSDILGATGAMTAIDLSLVTTDSGGFRWAEILSSGDGKPDTTYLAMGLSSGEILIYSGDNPAASNWSLIARFMVGVPVFYNCAIAYKNDVYALTENGFLSLRRLLSYSSQGGPDVSISSPIDPYLTLLFRYLKLLPAGIEATYAQIAYWPDVNKIYICIDGAVGVNGAGVNPGLVSTILVYNTISGAWAIHQIPGYGSGEGCFCYFNGAIYRAVGAVIYKYNLAVWKDEIIAHPGTYQVIPHALHSAYYKNLAGKGRYNHITGAELLINTDYDGASITMKMASDFGKKISAASSIPLQSGYQVAPYSVGAEGTFLQYRIEGSADVASTTGYELYSVGINVK